MGEMITERDTLAAIFGALLSAIVLMTALSFADVFIYEVGIKKAIKQCEAELPRHLYCEPVYGAVIASYYGEEIREEE